MLPCKLISHDIFQVIWTQWVNYFLLPQCFANFPSNQRYTEELLCKLIWRKKLRGSAFLIFPHCTALDLWRIFVKSIDSEENYAVDWFHGIIFQVKVQGGNVPQFARILANKFFAFFRQNKAKPSTLQSVWRIILTKFLKNYEKSIGTEKKFIANWFHEIFSKWD